MTSKLIELKTTHSTYVYATHMYYEMANRRVSSHIFKLYKVLIKDISCILYEWNACAVLKTHSFIFLLIILSYQCETTISLKFSFA